MTVKGRWHMSHLQVLLDTVEQLYSIHISMLQLADRKQNALIIGDIKELDEIVTEEMQAFQQISSLEQRRLEELKRISEQERIPESELTISRLIQLVKSPQEKQRMSHLAEEFPKVYAQLKEKNDTNARLLHQSLQFVQHTIQLLYPETEHTYNPRDPGSSAVQRTSLFDYKA
jgi:flagellar biosynthesis/type III secretory pathway chaperone